ncbi:MAG: zinc dependent phospholipase C family protein [Firmicutes bacterium]|nr:zinc dependent phospholipase C family protein [Bacillota bacterium]MDD3298947.1 zinc dependent phospholipase C family protein [Bacillota bacterium]MDD3851712.1 zinc dependent phospholipase C family protein [Bacillota bacterium]MDD4708064.1 zinc dependent phospholipase C family protein [Bacillota bacterium]
MEFFETTYGHILSTALGIANPVKKRIIRTECEVHRIINVRALKILKNDGHAEEYIFFSNYISDIGKGTVWADQDFKSSNHFYNPYKRKGLYGRKNAMDLGVGYYYKSIKLWHEGEFNQSLFFLGAALHIIQDMTIPQHANIRLLDSHRQYETFVKRTYQNIEEFQVERGAYLLDTIEEYIHFNARIALKMHKRFKRIANDERRYYLVTKCALPLAKRTTAGAMVMFYGDIFYSQ